MNISQKVFTINCLFRFSRLAVALGEEDYEQDEEEEKEERKFDSCTKSTLGLI